MEDNFPAPITPPERIEDEVTAPTLIASSRPQVGMPSAKAQSWGTLISIVVIVMMIVVGAFYAWGKRIAEQQTLIAPSAQ